MGLEKSIMVGENYNSNVMIELQNIKILKNKYVIAGNISVILSFILIRIRIAEVIIIIKQKEVKTNNKLIFRPNRKPIPPNI